MNKKDIVIKYIEENINNGKWKVASNIFSENQLIDYLGVSRVTIRLAINELCNKGVLETRQGSGTYIKGQYTNPGKYIIILTSIGAVTGDTNYIYRYFIDLLEKYIKSLGYSPIAYVGNPDINIEEGLASKLNDIGGIIFLYGLQKDLDVLNMLNIPIISSLGAFSNFCPGVLLDYTDLIYKTDYLLKKYNYKEVIIFKINQNNKKHVKENLVWLAMDSFFSNYHVVNMPISYDHNMKVDIFKSTISKIKKSPDCIVFMDDTIYLTASPYFQKYHNILKDTKIITHSSGNLETTDVYKICKIEFNLDKVAKETVNLIDKRINKINFNEYNIYIKPKVINEENLI